jgi:hypothetical protein
MHFARKTAWTLAAVFALGSIGLAGASARLMLWPVADAPERAGAVVVLAGGEGERLANALQLIQTATAPALVISNGDDPNWPEAEPPLQRQLDTRGHLLSSRP